jgi:diguanylate cyclase (GGDEF)-like protein
LFGRTADDLSRIRREAGIYANDAETVNEGRSDAGIGSSEMRLQHLANGRIIATTTQHASGGRVINIHQDITLLEELHAVLAKQRDDLEAKHSQLNIALANMVQGLSMFDRNLRLIVANKRFAEIYGIPLEMLTPGTHVRKLIKYRIDSGQFLGGSVETYLAKRIAAAENATGASRIYDLPDGRTISIRYVPLPEGGWVSTHEDITEATRKEAKITYMAQHDALTGLCNRYTLADRLKDEFSRCNRGYRFALLAIDLDYFKTVNDRHGHAVGDKLLSEVGARLKSITRETDVVARLGGDEFAILQSDIKTSEDALLLAQRIVATLIEPFAIDGHTISIGSSVGIALAPGDGDVSERLMVNCDLALYRAKELGRSSVCFFELALESRIKDRLALQQDLGLALRNGELELHYQPFVSLETDRISGVEALIRWRHPVRGLISPTDFIPLAEETGHIVSIGAWALTEACTTVAAWPSELKVAVNLSAVQFKREGLLASIQAALQASQIPPQRLELEITESLVLETCETVRRTLDQIHELGVSIALDDFGTGYSSLSYLQSVPFDKIKIDRSFIKNCSTDQRSIDIVRGIVGMAKALDMVVVAEGVETAEQRDIVRGCGCDQFQGYLFSQPRPASDIEAMLKGAAPSADASEAAA